MASASAASAGSSRLAFARRSRASWSDLLAGPSPRRRPSPGRRRGASGLGSSASASEAQRRPWVSVVIGPPPSSGGRAGIDSSIARRWVVLGTIATWTGGIAARGQRGGQLGREAAGLASRIRARALGRAGDHGAADRRAGRPAEGMPRPAAREHRGDRLAVGPVAQRHDRDGQAGHVGRVDQHEQVLRTGLLERIDPAVDGLRGAGARPRRRPACRGRGGRTSGRPTSSGRDGRRRRPPRRRRGRRPRPSCRRPDPAIGAATVSSAAKGIERSIGGSPSGNGVDHRASFSS